MSEGEERNAAYLTLGVEHLRNAVRYADRGRHVFFDEATPDTYLLVEGELRKAFESLNRLGRSFWRVNPALSQARIGEIRQLLTHDYTDVDPAVVWGIVTKEAPPLLRRLATAKVPKPR